MDTPLLAHLLRLRYRLLWAQVRTGRGKMALFAVGYLLLVFAGLLLTASGVLMGAAGTQMGRAEAVTRAVLGGLFLWAILASVFLGFSVNHAFSHAALRRYPLGSLARAVARHGIALLDPLWLLVLALYLGLAVGLEVSGSGQVWLGVPAAVALVLANYLTARVVVDVVERALRRWIGRVALFALALLVGVGLPALSAGTARQHAPDLGGLGAALRFTPPGTAAQAMAGSGIPASLAWLAALLVWGAALAAALAALERRPPETRAQAGGTATWDGPCDRVAALCGRTLAPLVSKQLRYYVRSAHLRWNYPLALPMVAWIALFMTRDLFADRPLAPFLAVLGALPALGMCTGGLSLNVFGFDGAGFRRYFLLPVPPARVLLAAALVGLLPGLSLVPVALLAWVAYKPEFADLRLLGMLLCSAIGGLLLYQALGLWSSLLGPKAMPLGATFGKRLSWAGGVIMMVSIMTLFWGPRLAIHVGDAVLRHGWALPLFAGAAAVFFAVTLALGSGTLVRRRERMLSAIDVGAWRKGG
ncbi:MAG: hypothetical protein AB1505_16635 [Candidatus Latescibacterota bacterium]